MIYQVLFGSSEEELLQLRGSRLKTSLAGSRKEAEERALEEMRWRKAPFALIFIETPDLVKLSLLSLEDETVKALENLGAWIKGGE